jgi:cytochrome b involved in lipid metabolism
MIPQAHMPSAAAFTCQLGLVSVNVIPGTCRPYVSLFHSLTFPLSNTHNMSKTFTANDVASHNKPDNLYIIVDHDVYDLTKFQEEHPGGKKST